MHVRAHRPHRCWPDWGLCSQHKRGSHGVSASSGDLLWTCTGHTWWVAFQHTRILECVQPLFGGLRYRMFPSSQKVLLPYSKKIGSISPLKIGRLLGMLENFWSSPGWEESLVRMRNRKRLTPFLPLQPFQQVQAAVCASTPGAICTQTQSHSPALSASCQPEARRWGRAQDRSGTRGRLRVEGPPVWLCLCGRRQAQLSQRAAAGRGPTPTRSHAHHAQTHTDTRAHRFPGEHVTKCSWGKLMGPPAGSVAPSGAPSWQAVSP